MTQATLRILGTALLLLPGCIDYLEPGEVGQMRYIDDVRGAPPLRMRAPISDREGNMYVLYGNYETPEIAVYSGGARGAWGLFCNYHENSQRGVHGWIGSSDDRAWYWSGDAFVQVSETGCSEILDIDPSTAADIGFKAVIPWIRETPSRVTAIAMIKSPGDLAPFFGVIELDQSPVVYSNLNEFVPRSASGVTVLGVGADPEREIGFVALHYRQGEEIRAEMRYLNAEGEVGDIIAIQDTAEPGGGAADLTEDAMVGFMQMNAAGWGAGVLRDGRLLVFGGAGGQIVESPFEAAGVHRWDDDVYIVGLHNGRPATALLASDGRVGTPQVWETSERALASIQSGLEIMDNRFQPVDFFTWPVAQPAIGTYPFLQPNNPPVYARGTTLLLIGGPSFQSGGEDFTPVAVGPVGLSYP